MVVNFVGSSPTAILQNAQAGMRAGENQVAQASHEIARQPLYQQEQRERLEGVSAEAVPTTDNAVFTDSTGLRPTSVTRELINLSEGEMVFRANARSIEAAQSMFDALLVIGRPQEYETEPG